MEHRDDDGPLAVAARSVRDFADLAIIQLSSNFCCLIYQIAVAGVLPPGLRALLENSVPERPMVWISVPEIEEYLATIYSVVLNPLIVDVRTLADQVYGPDSDNWTIHHFSWVIFGVNYKVPRRSWCNFAARRLRKVLVLAAALDVHVTLRVYEDLIARADSGSD